MNKPIIGIISPRNIEEDRPFNNYTKIIHTYCERITEAGGIPIGITFPKGQFEIEPLDLCDGFVFQGGPRIESYQINAIKYAIENKKPILGICLGLQTMAGFNWINDELGDMVTYSLVDKFFKSTDEISFLEKIEGHNNLDPFYLSQIEKSKHDVILDKDSRLYQIYGKDIISEPSIHNYAVKKDTFDNSKIFKVVGKSPDGVIEAIEGIDKEHFMIGVQFHPELEKDNENLFKEIVKEAKSNKR